MKRTKRVIALFVGAAMILSQLTMPGIGKRALADNGFQDLDQSQITEAMGAGWNLGNQLEASNGGTPSETAYGNPVIGEDLIKAVKKAGFRSIRIPVSYLSKIGSEPDYTIDSAWLDRVQQVVDMCMDNDLYAIINMHGDGYTSVTGGWLYCGDDDSAQEQIKAKYKACWKQIATRFQSYDEHLIYESMNEEFDGSYGNPPAKAYANINAYNQIFVDTVRQTGGNNDKRWLLIPGWNTNINYTADNYGFQLPTDSYRSGDIAAAEQRIMISVHYYDPWDFCGTEDGSVTQWGDAVTDSSKKASWGDESYLKSQFQKLQSAFVQKGYPVVIGEYGSIDKSTDDSVNAASRVEFAGKVCSYAKKDGLIPVYWDNGHNGHYGFGLFNRYNSQVTQQEIIDGIMEVYGSATGTSTPKTTTAAPSASAAGATDTPSTGVEREILFENGSVGESYETNDASWLVNGKDKDTLTVIYTCTEADHAGWGILGWGASVDGEWKEGKGYSAGSPASTEVTDTCTLKELREALDISSSSAVSYLKLSAYNGGKILKIYLEKEASATPTATPTASATVEVPTATPTASATVEVPIGTPTASATVEVPIGTPTASATAEVPTATSTASATAEVQTDAPAVSATGGVPTQRPSAIPATTETPGITDIPVPGTSDVPDTTPVPGTSDAPDTTPVPGISGAPDTTPVPGTSDAPDTTPVPGTSDAPDTTPVPGNSDVPDTTPVPGTSDAPDTTPVPGTSDAPDTTPVPGTSDVPDTTPVPETSDVPDTTPVPGNSGAPGTTFVPEVTETPGKTTVPGVSGTPAPKKSPIPGSSISAPVQQEQTKKMYVTQKYSLTAGEETDVESCHSSNAKVARVDSSGRVSALKAGSAEITITYVDGTSVIYRLQVVKPKVTLKHNRLSIRKGQKARIEIKKKLFSDKVKKYCVKNKSVVRVTAAGKVTGRKKGRTYVTVIMKSGVRKQCRITVK